MMETDGGEGGGVGGGEGGGIHHPVPTSHHMSGYGSPALHSGEYYFFCMKQTEINDVERLIMQESMMQISHRIRAGKN